MSLGRRTLKEKAYLKLKERILRGKPQAGDPLPEIEIAKALGISRTPVREAILQLEKDGLVEIFPNRGAYVTFISLKDLKDTIQLLQILEGAAARMAADRIDLAKLEKIEAEFKALQDKEEQATYEEAQEIGVELHELILQAARNGKIINVLHSTREQFRVLCSTSIKTPGRVPEAIKEHLKIITTLKDRDGLAAESAMVAHLDSMYHTLLESLA